MADESFYRFETGPGCSIVTLLPELNDKQWADIERVGSEIVTRLDAMQSPKLLVDLTPLSYMGSAMVALILRVYKAVTSRNGKIAVVNSHELVFEVLKLAGLTKLWTIVDSREKGFAALGISARASATTSSSGTGGGNALLLAGVLGMVGAILGLALQFAPSQPVAPRIASLIQFACAALGMISGTMMLVNQAGGRRNLGIVVLAVCLLVVLGGIMAAPHPAPPSAPAATSETSETPNTAVGAAPANIVLPFAVKAPPTATAVPAGAGAAASTNPASGSATGSASATGSNSTAATSAEGAATGPVVAPTPGAKTPTVKAPAEKGSRRKRKRD